MSSGLDSARSNEAAGRPRVVGVAHGGSLFLIDSGRPVPNFDPTEPMLRAGWIYDWPGMTLMPGGGTLPVGTYLSHGTWEEVVLPPEEIAAIEASVTLLLADEQ